MKKKIAYYIRTIAHKRSFETLVERDDFEQIVVGPPPTIMNGIKQGYDDFGIKNIKITNTIEDSQKIIDAFKPDVLAQAEFEELIKVPKSCKRVFVGHGMTGNHTTKLFAAGVNKAKRSFDYYCVSTSVFENFVNHLTAKKNKVLLNAIPQFDLLYDKEYYTKYKNDILERAKKTNPSLTILFCGFCCKNRPDYNLHNEDYISTVVELAKISGRNNWLSIIKPRQHHDKAINFMKKTKSLTKYIKPFTNAINSDNLYCIDHRSNTYRYLFADVIICNACSTVEIEACAINKPLILVRTKSGSTYDPLETVSYGAAKLVKNINHLEQTIKLISIDDFYVEKQKKLLKSRGIVVDGQAYKRVQDLIFKIS